MGVSSDSRGIQNALKKMAREHKKAEKKALDKASKVVAKQLEKNTPYDSFDDGDGHLKDNVVIGSFKDGELRVGYDKDVAWRVHFIEFGTIKFRPNQGLQFMQETVKETEKEVLEVIEKEIRKELGL